MSKDLEKALEKSGTAINEAEAKLTHMTIKGRYLQYLGTKEQGDDELREDCIICMGSSDDTQAVILECGHFFCNVGLSADTADI
jgi:E3 ubiquitin-protein ligase SHPRH